MIYLNIFCLGWCLKVRLWTGETPRFTQNSVPRQILEDFFFEKIMFSMFLLSIKIWCLLIVCPFLTYASKYNYMELINLNLLLSGLLTETERIMLDGTPSPHNKYWIPCSWASHLAALAREEGRLNDELHLKCLLDVSKYLSLALFDWQCKDLTKFMQHSL